MCMCDFSAVFSLLSLPFMSVVFNSGWREKKLALQMQKLEKKRWKTLLFSLFFLFEVLATKSLGAFQSRNPRFQNVAFLLGLSILNDASPCFANLPPSTSFHSRWAEFLLILAFSLIFLSLFSSLLLHSTQASTVKQNELTEVFLFYILVYSCSSFGVFECVYICTSFAHCCNSEKLQ